MTRGKKRKGLPAPDDPHGVFVEVAAEHLRERLALLKGVLYKRAVRKDLASYQVMVHPDGTATIGATDLETRLLLKLTVLSHSGSGTLLIDGGALDAMIGAYAEPKVRLHLDDAEKVKVQGLQTKLTLPGHDPAKELKATVPGSLTQAGWIVRGTDLVRALEQTRFATDPTSTRYALNGVALIFPEKDGDPVEVVATDGRRLALGTIPVRKHGEPERVWRPEKGNTTYYPILPCKAIPIALKLARARGDGSVGLAVIPGEVKDLKKEDFGRGEVQVVTPDAVLTTKVPEGRFPRFREVFPTGPVRAEFVLDDARRLGTLLETAAGAADSESKGVEMVLAGGCLMLTVESVTKGKAVLSLLVPGATGKGTFTVDALMLRQFFDVIGDDPVQCQFFGPKDPLLFRSGSWYSFVIMPMSRGEPYVPPAQPPKPGPPAPPPEPAAPVEPPPPPAPAAPAAVSVPAPSEDGEAIPPPPPPKKRGRGKK